MSRLTRDGKAEFVSRDQILRRERGQGIIHFPSSADHEQDWQPYPVDLHSCCMRWAYVHKSYSSIYMMYNSSTSTCMHTYIHTEYRCIPFAILVLSYRYSSM